MDIEKLTREELVTLYNKQEKRLTKILKMSDKQSNEIVKLNSTLQDMAYLDPMTNVHNRRYFFDEAERTLSLSKREKKALTLAMIDIDKFKAVNDTHGHDVGDLVIIELCKEVKKTIRDSDIFARFGGEEFILMFPNTNLENALIICEKIRTNVEKIILNDIKFTISIGLADFKTQTDNIQESIEEVIKVSDNGLYKAKENGRNRIEQG